MEVMKKVFLLPIFIFGCSGMVFSQTIYEAANLLDNDLNGTARYVGMGGAMNALGGDISVISSNPAGIGIYRSNDIVFSMGTNTAVSSMTGNKSKNTMFSFDNAGFVYAMDFGKKNPVRFVNLAFNYKKRKNFNNTYFGQWGDGNSQTQLIADMATNGVNYSGFPGYEPKQFEASNAYVENNPYVGWLPIMAYNSYLINPIVDKNGNFDGYWSGFENLNSVDHYYENRESGWINDYDFNISFNVNDNVYLGATLTAVDVKYNKTSLYKEDFYDTTDASQTIYDGGYDISNYFATSGSGLGFSLGAIVRLPSNVRLGLSFATPTIYWLTDYQESTLSYGVYVYDSKAGKYVKQVGSQSPYDASGALMGYQYSYRVRTPWKLNVSAAATLLNRLALDVEYEYRKNTNTKVMYDDGVGIDVINTGYGNDLIGGIDKSMKQQNIFKIGAELALSPYFSARAGFNYTSALMDSKNAFKFMESSSARTDTEYSNLLDRYSIACGIGYHRNHFYADMAYQYMNYKSEFYAFDNINLKPMDLSTKKHQVLLSIGFRF